MPCALSAGGNGKADRLARAALIRDNEMRRQRIESALHTLDGRPRLFEVIRAVEQANAGRKYRTPQRTLTGETTDAAELAANPSLGIAYHVAPPRMALYMDYSMRIYEIYLRHVSPADIHIYSIDEVFIDVTSYLYTGNISAHDFAMRLIREVLRETGITATAGIGTNLYLAKVAMDIVAKHMNQMRTAFGSRSWMR